MVSYAAIERACSVYCYGLILHTLQLSGLFNDSKSFVDMPMRHDPEQVNANFLLQVQDPSNTSQLQAFLDYNFYPIGSDLNTWLPSDFQEYPAFLDTIDDPLYRQWAYDINQLWDILGRVQNVSVFEYPQRTSFLPRDYPMIVPGGRFRESYYWDSWWIVRGLLVCDMFDTAEYVIYNLIDDVMNFGFVPNGGRIYYLDRSQPPFLSEMIISYLDYFDWKVSERITAFLAKAYPALKKEHEWWMNPDHGHVITLTNPNNPNPTLDTLNIYYSNESTPRPESYAEDYHNGNGSVDFYHNIRAGAESGWDFSSRWLGLDDKEHSNNLTFIHTSSIIPVELNSILYKMELNMIKLSEFILEKQLDIPTVEDSDPGYFYTSAANRKNAIQTWLWDEATSKWSDYNLTSSSFSQVNSISSWIPLWAGLATDASNDLQTSILDSLINSNLIQVAGVLTTSTPSDQQWDSPNAWPPLVHLIIEGLHRLSIQSAHDLSDDIKAAWLNTCYLAFDATGYMYEKYDAYEVGKGGGGGEYVPQVGFGWTNGVALVLLNNEQVHESDDGESKETALIIGLTVGFGCGVLIVMLGGYFIYRRKYGKNPAASDNSSLL